MTYPRKARINKDLITNRPYLLAMRGKEFWVLGKNMPGNCCGICYGFEFPDEIEKKYFEDMKRIVGLRRHTFDWVD